MQAEYPNKCRRMNWDPVNVEYPVRKNPETGVSSEIIARQWKPAPPEADKGLKRPVDIIKEYARDYNIMKGMNKSQTTVDFGFKQSETERFNKHTPLTENHYIYPPSRRLADRPPMCNVHDSTETRSSYTYPFLSPRLVTDKDQFKHPATASIYLDPPAESYCPKDLEPLDTTHEGFEIYLDPYLTTSRLHHRPYTADQLSRPSVSKDIVTYYTCADVPWIRSPKPDTSNWQTVNLRPKSSYDRDVFKHNHREIRTHNKLHWVPGSFRTEARDNYVPRRPQPNVDEGQVKTFYNRSHANLPTKIPEEDFTIRKTYFTENSHVGSGKPLCSIINQHVEKNKRLDKKIMRIV